jgi:hypothetical protein
MAELIHLGYDTSYQQTLKVGAPVRPCPFPPVCVCWWLVSTCSVGLTTPGSIYLHVHSASRNTGDRAIKCGSGGSSQYYEACRAKAINARAVV